MEQDNNLSQAIQTMVSMQAQQLQATNQLNYSLSQQKATAPSVAASTYSVAAQQTMEQADPVASSPKFMQSSLAQQFLQRADRTNRFAMDYQTMQYSSNLGAKAINGVAGVTKTAIDIGSLFAGGLGTGLIAPVLAGYGIDKGIVEPSEQFATYNSFLFKNSGRFIDMFESKNERYGVGFSDKQRWSAANSLRHIQANNYLSTDDMTSILQGLTDNDLLRDTNNVKSFRDKVSKMTKAVKESALIVNDTYQNITNLVGEMKKLGFNEYNTTNTLSGMKILSGLSGMNVQDTTKYVVNQSANNVSGTSLDFNKQLNQDQIGFMITAKNFNDSEKDRFKSKDALKIYNEMNNAGGAQAVYAQNSQLTENLFSRDSFAKFKSLFFEPAKDGKFTFNSDKYNEFINGNMSLNQLDKLSRQKMNSWDPSQTQEFLNNRAEFTKDTNLQMGTVNNYKFMKKMLEVYKKSDPDFKNFSDTGMLGILGQIYGPQADLLVNDMNVGNTNGDALIDKLSYGKMKLSLQTAKQANNVPFWVEDKKDLDEFLGDTFGSIGIGIQKQFDSIGQSLHDKLYNTQYEKNYLDGKVYDYTKKGQEKKDKDVSSKIIKEARGKKGKVKNAASYSGFSKEALISDADKGDIGTLESDIKALKKERHSLDNGRDLLPADAKDDYNQITGFESVIKGYKLGYITKDDLVKQTKKFGKTASKIDELSDKLRNNNSDVNSIANLYGKSPFYSEDRGTIASSLKKYRSDRSDARDTMNEQIEASKSIENLFRENSKEMYKNDPSKKEKMFGYLDDILSSDGSKEDISKIKAKLKKEQKKAGSDDQEQYDRLLFLADSKSVITTNKKKISKDNKHINAYSGVTGYAKNAIDSAYSSIGNVYKNLGLDQHDIDDRLSPFKDDIDLIHDGKLEKMSGKQLMNKSQEARNNLVMALKDMKMYGEMNSGMGKKGIELFSTVSDKADFQALWKKSFKNGEFTKDGAQNIADYLMKATQNAGKDFDKDDENKAKENKKSVAKVAKENMEAIQQLTTAFETNTKVVKKVLIKNGYA